jgi:hypothetical protein
MLKIRLARSNILDSIGNRSYLFAVTSKTRNILIIIMGKYRRKTVSSTIITIIMFLILTLQIRKYYKESSVVHLMILTSPQNFEKRRIQRQWLLSLKEKYTYSYVIGNLMSVEWTSNLEKKEFEEEYRKYKDFISVDVEEKYRLLGKKVILGLKRIRELYTAKYYAKTDDDINLNVNLFYKLFDDRKDNRNFYWGYIYQNASPIRDPNNKWFVSNEEYPTDKYPPYACGPFYVLSDDVVKEIISVSKNPNFQYFSMEDVQTGILMRQLKVSPTSNNGSFYCKKELSKDPTVELFIH